MTKEQLIQKLNECELTNYKIRKYGNVFKVSINWRDYLKVKHLISEYVVFVF